MVEKTQTKHPAKFGDAILDAIARRLQPGWRVLDPFAGTGRIFELEDRCGVFVTGVELEHEWVTDHPRHICADSLAWMERHFANGQALFDCIATSPAFGNRMADNHNARDDSKRITYRHFLGRPLSENNSGGMPWGKGYRDFHLRAWTLAGSVLRPGGFFILNIKNFIRQGEVVDVTGWHDETLRSLGFELIDVEEIDVPGMRFGANGRARVTYESVLTYSKS